MSSLTPLRVLIQTSFKALMPLRPSFSYLLTILTEYGTNTLRTSTLLSILKLGGTIIATVILIHTNSPNDWKTGKNSKKLLRRQNKTSLLEKSMRLPIKIAVLGNS